MIEFTDVVKSYTVGNKALNGITMQIEDGEFVFLVGPSGSGKSTIMKLITGELRPTSRQRLQSGADPQAGDSLYAPDAGRRVPGLPADPQYDGV